MCTHQGSAEVVEHMEALVACNRAVSAGPVGGRTYLRRAEALYAVRDVEGAVADYTRAIETDPPLESRWLAQAYLRRSICRHQLGRFDDAECDAGVSLELWHRPAALA
ncbi:MAG: tetratricopeptide repeat protein, partial [Acidimicrobiia bacterium]